MDIKVYLSSFFEESCPREKIDKLVQDFKQYKTTGIRPPEFGRDASFDRPSSVKQAELQHLHLKDSTSANWHLKTLQFNMTSNTALIYCHGFFDKNKFLLLGFLEGAHQTYQNSPHYLPSLAEIAERFRARF